MSDEERNGLSGIRIELPSGNLSGTLSSRVSHLYRELTSHRAWDAQHLGPIPHDPEDSGETLTRKDLRTMTNAVAVASAEAVAYTFLYDILPKLRLSMNEIGDLSKMEFDVLERIWTATSEEMARRRAATGE